MTICGLQDADNIIKYIPPEPLEPQLFISQVPQSTTMPLQPPTNIEHP